MRVLSLVPSATETLLALGVQPIACTRFCEQPEIATVGGTKNPDVAAILDLAPDLVVMNDEENRHEDFVALTDAGMRIHSMSPRALDDVGPAVHALAGVLGVATPSPFGADEWPEWQAAQREVAVAPRRCITFVWRRPWMALGHDTYGSAVLATLGLENAVASGTRYPEIALEAISGTGADLVLLPSEPYAFGPRHRGEVQGALSGIEVRLVDGQDLFWWGARTPGAVERMRTALH